VQDKQRGQNQTQENTSRSVRTKTCKRCGTIYLPKDNTGTGCARHAGRCLAVDPEQSMQYLLPANQVQQAIWSLRRKKKKIEAEASLPADLGIMIECGVPLMQIWRRLEWRWTCCGARHVSAVGCYNGPHS
jgi:hypothetical protein